MILSRKKSFTRPLSIKARSFIPFLLFIFSIFNVAYSQKQPLRTVSIKVAVDEETRMNSMWHLGIVRIVAGVSKTFEKNFGIKLRIKKYEYW